MYVLSSTGETYHCIVNVLQVSYLKDPMMNQHIKRSRRVGQEDTSRKDKSILTSQAVEDPLSQSSPYAAGSLRNTFLLDLEEEGS